jgi:hypothetical protein
VTVTGPSSCGAFGCSKDLVTRTAICYSR